jgi:hypothetical protein
LGGERGGVLRGKGEESLAGQAGLEGAGERLRRLFRRFAFVAGAAFLGKLGLSPAPSVRVWEVRVEAEAYCERGRLRPPQNLILSTRIPARPAEGSGTALAASGVPTRDLFDEVGVDLAETSWQPIWTQGRDLWLVERNQLRRKRPRASLEDVGVLLGSVDWSRLRCSEEGRSFRVSLPLWMNPEDSTYARRDWSRLCRWGRTALSNEGSWLRLSQDSISFRQGGREIRIEGTGARPTGTGLVSCMLDSPGPG